MPSFVVYKKRKVGDKLEVQIGKKPDNEGVLSVLIDLPLDIFFEVCTVLVLLEHIPDHPGRSHRDYTPSTSSSFLVSRKSLDLFS